MQVEGMNRHPEQQLRGEIKSEFTRFIQEFRNSQGDKKYEIDAGNLINTGKHHLMFSFRDLLHHNQELASLIFENYYKFEPIINEALTQFMH